MRRRAEQRGWTAARAKNRRAAKAGLFCARDGGKPRVAQPPQQDRPKCEDRRAGEITTERMPANQEAAKRILFGGEVVGVIDPAARPIRSMTDRNAQAPSIFEGQAHLVSLLYTPICGTFCAFLSDRSYHFGFTAEAKRSFAESSFAYFSLEKSRSFRSRKRESGGVYEAHHCLKTKS